MISWSSVVCWKRVHTQPLFRKPVVAAQYREESAAFLAFEDFQRFVKAKPSALKFAVCGPREESSADMARESLPGRIEKTALESSGLRSCRYHYRQCF